MKEKYPLLAIVFLLVLGFLMVSAIMAWPTQFLWNRCLVPAVTFANQITFWQAFGLNFLAAIFFKANTSLKSKE